MSINVFGQPLGKTNRRGLNNSRGPPGVGFKLTETGDYDLDYKRLCRVSTPIDPTDADNLDALKKTIDRFKTQYDTILEEKFQEKSVQSLNTVLADLKADQLYSIRVEYIKNL